VLLATDDLLVEVLAPPEERAACDRAEAPDEPEWRSLAASEVGGPIWTTPPHLLHLALSAWKLTGIRKLALQALQVPWRKSMGRCVDRGRKEPRDALARKGL
jgi:hypothetical protein